MADQNACTLDDDDYEDICQCDALLAFPARMTTEEDANVEDEHTTTEEDDATGDMVIDATDDREDAVTDSQAEASESNANGSGIGEQDDCDTATEEGDATGAMVIDATNAAQQDHLYRAVTDSQCLSSESNANGSGIGEQDNRDTTTEEDDTTGAMAIDGATYHCEHAVTDSQDWSESTGDGEYGGRHEHLDGEHTTTDEDDQCGNAMAIDATNGAQDHCEHAVTDSQDLSSESDTDSISGTRADQDELADSQDLTDDSTHLVTPLDHTDDDATRLEQAQADLELANDLIDVQREFMSAAECNMQGLEAHLTRAQERLKLKDEAVLHMQYQLDQTAATLAKTEQELKRVKAINGLARGIVKEKDDQVDSLKAQLAAASKKEAELVSKLAARDL
ncbi:hypothetical protein A1Q2_05715 [Trichosporon asahii var. asahii CBS 8904]|uniref:Uncharacterized protein n=1 Tax=Trichosporon asahii var. asahii (strain CBS 8904) TaxID=1220162 RepID=K1VGN2_TRIAC|nr:hypothetical protein A1Q2_05715 [Trichosporon asahii var. asahii CBS 8904]